MKRYAYYLLIMAAAAMVACEAEPVNNSDPETPEVPELQNGTYIYTINAAIPEESTPDQVAVKSDYDADGHFSWSAGDAISVLFHDSSKEDSDPEKNKFFTLTLTSGAGNKSASFSGAITSGYTIGASDGDALDKKIWALFPASTNHTYTIGENPSFYVQPSVDFTATHFSANVPMYALNADEGALSFANLASTYKFIVTGIKAGVSKVRFTIYNQTTYGLSGSWPIHNDKYINYNYATPGSEKSTLSYVSNVTSNEAVFYVSCRYWGTFQPHITVANCATDATIKTFVAGKSLTPTTVSNIQPVTLDVSEANGGVYYTPAITIDGDLSDWAGIAAYASAATSRIREWKIKTDPYFVFVYVKLRKDRVDSTRSLYIGFETDNDSATGTGDKMGGLPAGLDAYAKVVPYTNASGASVLSPVHGLDASSKTWSKTLGTKSGTVYVWDYDDGSAIAEANNVFIEFKINREELALPAAGSSISVNIAYNDYVAGVQSVTLE